MPPLVLPPEWQRNPLRGGGESTAHTYTLDGGVAHRPHEAAFCFVKLQGILLYTVRQVCAVVERGGSFLLEQIAAEKA